MKKYVFIKIKNVKIHNYPIMVFTYINENGENYETKL